MTRFSWPRFSRLIRNDALRIARPVLYGALTLLALALIIYMSSYKQISHLSGNVSWFGICLTSAGMLFTGSAFQDMHDPLERNHYLMLPVSNLERLLSRYLLTGPLFIVYGTLVFTAVNFVCTQLVMLWFHVKLPLFSPLTASAWSAMEVYFFTHIVMIIGSIGFRCHDAIKTILFATVAILGLAVVEELAERIFFPEYYSWTRLGSIKPLPVNWAPWFAATWMNVIGVIAITGWLLYIAYLYLRDYEATDGV